MCPGRSRQGWDAIEVCSREQRFHRSRSVTRWSYISGDWLIKKQRLLQVGLVVSARRSRRTAVRLGIPNQVEGVTSQDEAEHWRRAWWLANWCPGRKSMRCAQSSFCGVNSLISGNRWLRSVTRHMKGSELSPFIASHFCKILPVLPVNSPLPFVWNMIHSTTHNVTDCCFLWTPCSLCIISSHSNSRGRSTIPSHP